MISEIELLKEDIPSFEKRFGEGNMFVEVLKAQLASLQNPCEAKRQKVQVARGIFDFLKSLVTKQ